MSNAMRLLTAFIKAEGYDIEEKIIGVDQSKNYILDYDLNKRKKDKRTAKEIKYDDDFLALWQIYPKRAGNNSKIAAYKAYSARSTGNVAYSKMMEGVKRYAAFIEGTDRLNTEYVLMGATFFGPSEHYLADWEIPKKKLNKEQREKKLQELKAEAWAMMPGSMRADVLRSFAIEHDYKQPGEIKDINDLIEYKRLLKTQIDARTNKEL